MGVFLVRIQRRKICAGEEAESDGTDAERGDNLECVLRGFSIDRLPDIFEVTWALRAVFRQQNFALEETRPAATAPGFQSIGQRARAAYLG